MNRSHRYSIFKIFVLFIVVILIILYTNIFQLNSIHKSISCNIASLFNLQINKDSAENIWNSFLSSIAQTIAGCSALLIAIALIKLQYLDNSLKEIINEISRQFFENKNINKYLAAFLPLINHNDYKNYFLEIKKYAENNANMQYFTSTFYLLSSQYLISLVNQGIELNSHKIHLFSKLISTFKYTLIFSGINILLIPFAGFASMLWIYVIWGLDAIFLIFLSIKFLRLIEIYSSN